MGVSRGSVRSRLNLSPGCSAVPRAISVLFVPTPPSPAEPRATLLWASPPSRSPGGRRQKVPRSRWIRRTRRPRPGLAGGGRWARPGLTPRHKTLDRKEGALRRRARPLAPAAPASSQSRGGSANAWMGRGDVMHPVTIPEFRQPSLPPPGSIPRSPPVSCTAMSPVYCSLHRRPYRSQLPDDSDELA